MGAGHSHGIEKPAAGSAGARHRKSLVWALCLTTTFLVVEIIGAWISGSLALLADAAHMLTDAGGLALALFAIWFAARPPTASQTLGYVRAEVLAALITAVVLLLLAVYILYEAWQRFFEPPEVLSTPMLIVAVVGLVVNLISMRLLAAGSEESLNLKGAYFEVLADMLGSIGVIASALIIMFTGWTLADPIIGAAIGIFIVPRTWALLKHSVNILLEGAPIGFDLKKPVARCRRHARPPRLDHHLGDRRDERTPGGCRWRRPAGRAAGRQGGTARGVRHRPHHHPDRDGHHLQQ